MVGAILTGIFCLPTLGGYVENVNVVQQLIAQIAGILLTVVYCGFFTWLIFKIIDKTIGLRASNEQEQIGLDISNHNERAYN